MEGTTFFKAEGQADREKNSITDETTATTKSSPNTTGLKREDQDEKEKDYVPLKICHLRQTGQEFTPVELIKAYTAISKERTGIDYFPEDRFRVHVLNDLREGHLIRHGQGKRCDVVV